MNQRSRTAEYILLSILACVLFGCVNKNHQILILTHNKTITQYSDTIFNSSGYIGSFSRGYVISDYANKFIALTDYDVSNLEIIGRIGRAQNEYPYIPQTFIQVENNLYLCVAKKLYVYDLQTKIRTQADISSISKFIKNDLIFHRGDQLIFSLQGMEYNFASYDINNGGITYFHKNSTLNKLIQTNTYATLLDNGMFVVVEYDSQTKNGFMHAFSLSNDDINEAIKIPLNRGMMDILEMVPQAPAFDGVCSWKNRVFIAYNSTGLITTELNRSAEHNDWIFLNYPDEEENDRVILSNFCVTDDNLIFFNKGLLRFYKNPF
jgi:hypothetical protein